MSARPFERDPEYAADTPAPISGRRTLRFGLPAAVDHGAATQPALARVALDLVTSNDPPPAQSERPSDREAGRYSYVVPARSSRRRAKK